MPTVSRRGLFVLGGTGAAGAVLASCGGKTSERDDTDDAALLGTALAAETALGEAYASGGGIESAFVAASKQRADDLTRLVQDTGGEPAGTQGSGSSAPTEQAEATIAAYREAAGPLSTAELRRPMIEFLAAVAAELAALRQLAGDDPVPRAFVTGLPDEPNQAAEDTGDGSETTSTTTTTGEGE